MKTLSTVVAEKFTVWRYVVAGLIWGKASATCALVGGPPPELEDRLKRWEEKYSKLGYKLVGRDVWENAGAHYGEYKHALYQPKPQIEITAWYMRENHTFRKLSPGTELTEALAEFDVGHNYGMLCAYINGVSYEECVHARGDRERFIDEGREWLAKLAEVTEVPSPRNPLWHR